MIRFLLFFLSVISTNLFAQSRLYIPYPTGNGVASISPADALQEACSFAIGVGRTLYIVDPLTNYPTQDWSLVAQRFQLAQRNVGFRVEFQCRGQSAELGIRTAAASVVVGATCSAGLGGQLTVNSYVASFDSLNRPVSNDTMVNPQCASGCIVRRPVGGIQNSSETCIGYTESGVPLVLYSVLSISCTGGEIKQTGGTCGFIDSTEFSVALQYPITDGLVQVSIDGSQGGVGTNGGSLDVVDKANLSNIAVNTGATNNSVVAMSNALQGKLETLALNQTTGDANNESRYQEQKGILDSMLGALTSIDGKTGTGGSGTGNSSCGGTNQPACNVTLGGNGADGFIGAMPGDPMADAPQGGLVAPAEASMIGFIDGIKNAPARDAGACPKWTIEMDYFRKRYVMDAHCDLFDQNRSMLAITCTVIWTIGALGIVLRA